MGVCAPAIQERLLLFHSIAEAVRANAVEILLTGMGVDGAQGLLTMRQW
jgi:chemotaxis response regulator CheB